MGTLVGWIFRTTVLLQRRQQLSQFSKHIKYNVADVLKLFHMKREKSLIHDTQAEIIFDCKSYLKTFLHKLSHSINWDVFCKNGFMSDLFHLRFVNEAQRTIERKRGNQTLLFIQPNRRGSGEENVSGMQLDTSLSGPCAGGRRESLEALYWLGVCEWPYQVYIWSKDL